MREDLTNLGCFAVIAGAVFVATMSSLNWMLFWVIGVIFIFAMGYADTRR